MNYIKKFKEWIGLKEKLDTIDSKPVLFNEGEVWWCSVGENIGVEVSGKEKGFSRPVLVYKKLSKHGFLGIPMSTQVKQGSWYVHVTVNDELVVANLSQTRFFSSKRLYNLLTTFDENDFNKTKEAFVDLFCHNSPAITGGNVGNPKYPISISEQKVSSIGGGEIKIGQIWRHYKGKYYKILVFCRHSETAEDLVVYQRQEDGETYARPRNMFFDVVKWEGEQVPRFTLVSEE